MPIVQASFVASRPRFDDSLHEASRFNCNSGYGVRFPRRSEIDTGEKEAWNSADAVRVDGLPAVSRAPGSRTHEKSPVRLVHQTTDLMPLAVQSIERIGGSGRRG